MAAQSQGDLADRAELLIRSGDRDGGVEVLGQAAQATPATAESEDRIGFLYAVAGRKPDAIEHFRKSLSLDKNYAAAHFHLGVALWQGGDRDAALAELQEAAKLGTTVFDYQYRLAMARQQMGDLAGAADACARAVALDPANNAARNTYAYLLIETRQPDRGIEEARAVLAQNPADTSAIMNVGYANLKKGEYDLAEQAYRQAVTADPNSAAAHYDLGIALKMKDRIEDAQSEFKEAIRLQPSLAEAHYSLGISYWQLGDFANMTHEMRAALAIQPEYAEAHYMLGIALKQAGDYDGAITELKESIRLDPTTPGPYNTMGQILRIKGDKPGSEQAFATGARLKREKESQLANTLDQGMRGGTMPKAIAGGGPH